MLRPELRLAAPPVRTPFAANCRRDSRERRERHPDDIWIPLEESLLTEGRGGYGLGIDPGDVLYRRLGQHVTSIQSARNLELADFRCRYLLVFHHAFIHDCSAQYG